jgi:hypothetical protein
MTTVGMLLLLNKTPSIVRFTRLPRRPLGLSVASLTDAVA